MHRARVCGGLTDAIPPLPTGTSDRVLLLSGSLHSVLTAIFLILEKVARDTAANKARTGKGKEDREDEVGSSSCLLLYQVASWAGTAGMEPGAPCRSSLHCLAAFAAFSLATRARQCVTSSQTLVQRSGSR